MRDLLKKMTTVSMVAGAALFVAACGGSETANTADANMTTDNMSMESDMGTMNDVTAVDGAMGADANMAMDNMAMDANMSMDSNMSMDGGNMSNAM